MPARTLYFISDLHLGDGSPADRFLHPDAFLSLLDRIAGEPGAELVVVGDFLELWAAELGSVLTHHSPLFHRFLQLAGCVPVTYVVGNHDALPWYAYLGGEWGRLRITERYTTRLGGETLVAIHGHQYDPFNQIKVTGAEVHVPFSRQLTALMAQLERLGLGGALAQGQGLVGRVLAAVDRMEQQAAGQPENRTLHTLLNLARRLVLHESPGQRDYPLGESRYREAAMDWMRQGARWVIMGHTHHPERVITGRKTYINTGCWCWDKYPPLFARWAGGELSLLDARTGAPYSPS